MPLYSAAGSAIDSSIIDFSSLEGRVGILVTIFEFDGERTERVEDYGYRVFKVAGKTANELSHRMNERALKLGGTVSGEHGVGIGKIKYMEKEHGDAW